MKLKEVFKTIEGTNYLISNRGHVTNSITGYQLKAANSWNGYLAVSLSMGARGLKKKEMVHRLVARAFIPNPENKPEVNHLDLDKENNAVSNLEWVTKQENMNHAKEKGAIVTFRGESNANSVFLDSDIKLIRTAAISSKELADKFRVNVRTIQRIRSRESWKHIE